MWYVWFCVLLASGYVLLKLFNKYQKLSNKRYWNKLGIDVFQDSFKNFSLLDIILERYTLMDFERITGQHMKDNNMKIVGFTEFGNKKCIIRDLDMAKAILVKDGDIWINRIKFNINDPILDQMLIFMEGQAWKNMRSLLSPNFTTGKIKKMYERIEDCAQMLVSHLKDEIGIKGGEVDIPDTMAAYTMNVIASAFFGIEVNTIRDRNDMFAQMGKKMQKQNAFRMMKVIFAFMFPKIAGRFGVRFFDPESTDFFHRVVKQTIEYREKTGEKRQDFLQLLIDYKNDPTEDKKVLITDDIIGSQAVLFLLGGFDTESTLLIFTMYHLALYPDVQDKMLEEVERIKEKHRGKLDYEAINELELTERIINETLRLFPPAPRLERRNIQPYQIPGTNIILPQDSLVTIPNYSFHIDSEYFPDPDKFDPDRWLPEVKNERNPYAYMPFGQGPRNCVGMRFALVEAKSILAHLALNFKIEPTASLQIPIKVTTQGGGLKPKGGMLLKFTPRN